jgi:hypothetical protein
VPGLSGADETLPSAAVLLLLSAGTATAVAIAGAVAAAGAAVVATGRFARTSAGAARKTENKFSPNSLSQLHANMKGKKWNATQCAQ